MSFHASRMQRQVRFGHHRIHHGPPALLGTIACLLWLIDDLHDWRCWIPDLIHERR